MIKEAIIKLSQKQDLTYEEAEQVMNEIMEGKATDVQKSAYLTALSMKGETIDEITASAAGTGRILLISPLRLPWSSQRRASRWQSTATGRRPPSRGQQMFWRRWG